MKRKVFALMLSVVLTLTSCSGAIGQETGSATAPKYQGMPSLAQSIGFDTLDEAIDFLERFEVYKEVEPDRYSSESWDAYEIMVSSFRKDGYFINASTSLTDAVRAWTTGSDAYIAIYPEISHGHNGWFSWFAWDGADYMVEIRNTANDYKADISELGNGEALLEYYRFRYGEEVIIDEHEKYGGHIISIPDHQNIDSIYVQYLYDQDRYYFTAMLDETHFIRIRACLNESDANKAKALDFFNSLTFEKIPIPELEPSEPTDSTETAPSE